MAIDPICNMDVDPDTAEWSSEYMGKRYYFCAPGCKRMFDQDPARYVGGGQCGCSSCGGH